MSEILCLHCGRHTIVSLYSNTLGTYNFCYRCLQSADYKPDDYTKKAKYYIRVDFNDRNAIETWINGSMETIEKYYIGKEFTFHPEEKAIGEHISWLQKVELP